MDQVACGARIDAAAELGDLEKALELVSFMKKERAMARFRRFMDIVSFDVYYTHTHIFYTLFLCFFYIVCIVF